MLIAGVSVEDVESVLIHALPPHILPFMVLKCCETPYGVEVSAAEPPSPIQQAALDALRDRWPDG